MMTSATSSRLFALGLLSTAVASYLPAQVIWQPLDQEVSWHTAANWSGGSVPGSSTNVVFNSNNTILASGTPTSTITQNTQVNRLQFLYTYNQTDTRHHHLSIANDTTLRVQSSDASGEAFLIRLSTNNDRTKTVFSGGGHLVIASANQNFIIQNTHTSSSTQPVELSMEGLSSFTANVKEMQLGSGSNLTRVVVRFAENNQVTANMIRMGAAAGSNGGMNDFYFGQNNVFHTDIFSFGVARSSSRLLFNDGVSAASVVIRGKAGGDSRANLIIGNNSSSYTGSTGGSSNPAGTMDFQDSILDFKLDQLILGVAGSVASDIGGHGIGTLIMGAGSIDANHVSVGQAVNVNNLAIKYDTAPTADHGILHVKGGSLNTQTLTIGENLDGDVGIHYGINGRMTVEGGRVEVAGDVLLGVRAQAIPSQGRIQANLMLQGGTFSVGGDLKEGNEAINANTHSSLTLDGATLDMQGGAIMVDELNFFSGTLKNVSQITYFDDYMQQLQPAMLNKMGTGLAILDGENMFSGGMALSEGSLQLGSGGVTGSLGGSQIHMGANTTFSVKRQDAYELNQMLFGDATTRVIQDDLGKTLYSGDANTFEGSFEVRSGVLAFNEQTQLQQLGALQVHGGAILALETQSNAVVSIGKSSSMTTFASGAGLQIDLGSTLQLQGSIQTDGVVYLMANGSKLGGAPTGTYELFKASSGVDQLPFELRLTNARDFGVVDFSRTSTTASVSFGNLAALDEAYWVGGRVGGFEDSWSVSTSTTSNWASDSAGAVTALVPGSQTSVYLSQSASTHSNTRLDSDMTVGRVLVTQGSAFTLSDKNHWLSLTQGDAMTVAAGAGIVEFGTNLEFLNTVPVVDVAGTRALVLSGGLRGNQFTKTGSGILKFMGGGANLLQGEFIIDEGTVVLGKTEGAQAANSHVKLTSGSGSTALLQLGASEQIVDEAEVHLSGTSTWDLNGFNETIQGLHGDAGARVTNLAEGNSILTVNGIEGTDSIFAGVIENGGAGKTVEVHKAGAGTLTFSGDNTYTGGSEIREGTLQLLAAAALSETGAVHLAGSTARLLTGEGFTHRIGALTLKEGTITGLGTLDLRAGAHLESGLIEANLTGTGRITKTTQGTVTLGGSNTFTGEIQILEGKLVASADRSLGSGRSVILGAGDSAGANSTAGQLDIGSTTQTIGNLQIQSTHASSVNQIFIGEGGQLNLTGQNFYVGKVGSSTMNNVHVTLKVSGEGTLKMNHSNGRIYIGQSTGANVNYQANLDMQDLHRFEANLGATGNFRLGAGDNSVSRNSTLHLAQNNLIQGLNLNVGYSGQGAMQSMYLGSGVNQLYFDNLFIGSGSRDQGRLVFLPTDSTGTLQVRGYAEGTRTNLRVGVSNATTAGTGTNGTATGTGWLLDTRGHHAEFLLNQLIIGSQPRGNAVRAEFFFDQGTLDLNTLQMAIRGVNGSASANNKRETFATVHLGGGTSIIHQGITTFGHVTGSIPGTTEVALIRKAHATLKVDGDAELTIGATDGASIRMAIAEQATSGSGGSEAIGEIHLGGQAKVTVQGHIYEQGGIGTTTTSLTLTDRASLDMTGNTVVVDSFILESGTLKNLGQYARGREASHTVADLVKTTAGTLILEGDNAFTGNLRVEEGTVQIGSGGETGTVGAGSEINLIAANSRLSVNRSDTFVLNHQLQGAGQLVQAGAGTLVLGNTSNAHSGGSTVQQGILQVADLAALGSGTVRVETGAALHLTQGLTGTIDQVSSLNLANALEVQDGGKLIFEIGKSLQFSQTPAFGAHTLLNVSYGEGVTLADTLFTDDAWVYSMLRASGGLDDSQYLVGSFNSSPYVTTLDSVSDTEVRVKIHRISEAELAQVAYWNGGKLTGFGETWSASINGETNWNQVTGAARRAAIGATTSVVVGDRFSSTGLTEMNLANDMTLKSLLFESNQTFSGVIGLRDEVFGLTLKQNAQVEAWEEAALSSYYAGKALVETRYVQLEAAASKIHVHESDGVLELKTALRAEGFTQSGLGTLILSGAEDNAITGPVRVTSGALVLSKANGAQAFSGTLSIDGGASVSLLSDGSLASSSTVILEGGDFTQQVRDLYLAELNGAGRYRYEHAEAGTLSLGAANSDFTFSGVFENTEGQLLVNKVGTGVMTLNTASSHQGGYVVRDGSLKTGDSMVLNGVVQVEGGKLDIEGTYQSVSGLVLKGGLIEGATGTLVSSSHYNLQSGTVKAQLGDGGSSVGLVKSENGTVILDNANSFRGNVTINKGILRLRYS